MSAPPAADPAPATPAPRSRLALLFVAQALAVGATTGSQAMSSIVASQLGREAVAGLPSTTNTLAAALAAYPLGLLMARAGRRFGLVASYGLAGLGALVGFLGGRAGSFPLFLVGCALMGAAQGGYQQARYAAAESVAPARRAAAMSLLLFMSVLGSALSAVLAPVLDRVAPDLGVTSEVAGFLPAAALMVLSGLLTLGWRGPNAAAAPPGARRSAPGDARAAWRDPRVRFGALGLASAQGVMVTLMVLTPLRAHHLGHAHAAVAGLLLLHLIGMFGLSWGVGPLVDRFGPRFGLAVGSVLLVGAAALLPLTAPAALGLSIFLLGLGWNFAFVSGSALLAARREAQGGADALAYLAASVGALGGSLVAGHFGFGALALLGALAGLLPAVAAWRLGAARPQDRGGAAA